MTQVKKCVKTGNCDQCIFPSYAQAKDELCAYDELLLPGNKDHGSHSPVWQGGVVCTQRAPEYSQSETLAPQ